MAERLTKLKIFLRTPYYEINKGEKKKVANKLGVLEDILEKYNINSTEELDNALEFAKVIEKTLSDYGIKDNEELECVLEKSPKFVVNDNAEKCRQEINGVFFSMEGIMREIKFRAKRIDSGEWVYGYLYKCDKFARIITAFAYTNEDGENEGLGQYYCEAYDVDINTLSQFTGLYDKNGKEIYENDIVEWAGYTMKILWGEDCGIGYGFIWEPCGGNIDYAESMTGFIDEYEVIGNIFDNPGLLGEQQ